jgi:RNA polymerase sigma-70 factor, ECF subfamily
MYGVHRATAARWVERARRSLITGVRRIMREQLRVEETTLDSVLRLIDSCIDMSIPKLLGR